MERRYLVAALAIIATFAVTSRGFRTLEHLSLVRAAHAGEIAKSHCESSSAARALAKIGTHLRPRFPEEAQLLAEMNVPLAEMQTSIAEDMARQNAAITKCAREQAMRDAARAYRDAIKLQEKMVHSAGYAAVPSMPISVAPPDAIVPAAPIAALAPDIQIRIQEKAAALAARIAANSRKLQMANERASSMQWNTVDVPAVEISDDGGNVATHVHVHTRVGCKTSRTATMPKQPE